MTLGLQHSVRKSHHNCGSHDVITFRLGTVNGDLVSTDLTSGGTGDPDRDWSGEAPALLVPSRL